LDKEKNTTQSESTRATLSIVAGVLVATATRTVLEAYGAPLLVTLTLPFLSGGLTFLIGRVIGRWIEPRTEAQFWQRTETGVVTLLGLVLLVSGAIYIQSFPHENAARLALGLFVLTMLVVAAGVLHMTRTVGYLVLGLSAAQILGFFVTRMPLFLSLGIITTLLSILFFVKGPREALHSSRRNDYLT
jgi:hypothetical protein